MKPIYLFQVVPALPPSLERLRKLAVNLRWAWNHDTIELFRRLDSDLWEESGHNPVRMLGKAPQSALDQASRDDGFLAHLERVSQQLDIYLGGDPNWYRKKYGRNEPMLVAYFSAEFGITECLSIFAGGLGMLAGDHLKSASDLGVPLVAVGLLYQEGYFRQFLNASGWQQEAYEDNDFQNMPITLERDPQGNPVLIQVPYPGRNVTAQVWRADVGRVSLYLLDTNLTVNRPEDRNLTDQLYGGNLEMRLQQEILLGIGGLEALDALGISPTVFHMNEGHSAFLALARVRKLMETQGLTYAQARHAASAGLVFTTHTPVAAGHDYFPSDLIGRYFGGYMQKLGLSHRDFMGLGRRNPGDDSELFCMTVLALRLASFRNGVSKLHGKVSRQMWESVWPGVPEDEVPIGHVTNGVHFRSWISQEMNQLYDRYLGPRWRQEPAERSLWQRIDSIPAEELWRTHERRRERLVAFSRRRLHRTLVRRGVPQAEIDAADEVLDSEALTIGFARRFATYKRATLLLRNPERLARILNDPKRPVQIIFAGKAHPRDDGGKELIRQIVSLARQPEFRRRLVFLEDYDMAVARYLVQGVDVWLNTPMRPMEASGTSGMKALCNGVLNLSTLDGWWDEAWHEGAGRPDAIGWAIGNGDVPQNPAYQDHVESDALYELLERDVAPTFYDRRADGLPRRWIGRMKSSIASLNHLFNTHRMVQQYTETFYLPAHGHYQELMSNEAERVKELAGWMARLQEGWGRIRAHVVKNPAGDVPVGGKIQVRALVELGSLRPEDVAVELYIGNVNADGDLANATPVEMKPVGRGDHLEILYEAVTAPCGDSGLHGYTVRILPHQKDLISDFLPGMIYWAEPE